MILNATKKPVTIQAVQLTKESIAECYKFIHSGASPNLTCDSALDAWDTYTDIVKRDGMRIPTLEGEMIASVGDYIIRGVKGEFYPCKPDIFHMTYDIVNS